MSEIISKAAARRELGCSPKTINKLIAAGRLTVLRVPLAHPKLVRDEVLALRAASEVPRRVEAGKA